MDINTLPQFAELESFIFIFKIKLKIKKIYSVGILIVIFKIKIISSVRRMWISIPCCNVQRWHSALHGCDDVDKDALGYGYVKISR